MKLYAGIDLHSTNCVIVVVDEAGSIVRRSRLKNRLALIAAWLEPFRDSLVGVVVESTYNWYWLVDGDLPPGNRTRL
jgi:transposase